MMTRLGLGLIWLLHWLPLALLAPLGRAAGLLLYALAGERRRVVLTNLRLCFPDLREPQRVQLARNHFAVFTRSLLEHGILWWGSRERVLRMVRIEGVEHWRAVRDRPVIWLSPHFVGLDMGGIRLTAEYPLVSVYSKQKNPVFDAVLLHGRTRLGPTELYSRQDGIRPVAKAIKKGLPFYYLPDMDFGERDSMFVPFFGVPAATITGLIKIVRPVVEPWRPLKLRLDDDAHSWSPMSLSGFIARHIEHPAARHSNPASAIILSNPSFSHWSATICEPGTAMALMPGATLRPFRYLATS